MSLRLFMLWFLSLSLSAAWLAWPRGLEKREGELATVTRIKGAVSIRPAGSFSWSRAREGSSLVAFDTIATASKGRAEITLSNGANLILPPDTQVKIQAQSMIPGMTISLIKGGIEVQSGRQPSQRPSVPGMMLAAAKPITIQTAQYNVDLSQLKGQFKLQDADVKASQPETVRIQHAQGALSLTNFASAGTRRSLEDAVVEVPVETPPPPPPKLRLPVSLQAPEPPPLPKLAESPPPEALALVEEEPEEQVVVPRLRDALLNLWAPETLEESMDLPLMLPLGEPAPSYDTERWQSIMRIRVKDSKQFIIIKREPGEFGLIFSLRELEGILPAGNSNELSLIVETGLMGRSDDQGPIQMSDLKTRVRLQSLKNRQPVSVRVQGWGYVEPADDWIRTQSASGPGVTFHLMESLTLPKMQGYLRGAQRFSVVPLHASGRKADVVFVRGQSIVATTDSKDDNVIQGMIDQLEPDLVYRGSYHAFLGGRGSFDLNSRVRSLSSIYYVHRKRILKLDQDLINSHASARSFLEKFDPYFMSSQVQIIYSKE